MAYQTIKHGGRILSRWIPDNAIETREPLGVVYVYRANGKLLAIGYRGNAAKPSFHYSYRDMAGVDQAICNFFDSLKAQKERVSKYRQDSNSGHEFKMGDIVTNSWGYDQTNVDWYRVTKVTRNYVWLQPISAHVEETGFMSGTSAPFVDTENADPSKWGFRDKSEPVEMHKARGKNVNFQYGSGSKWDGEKKYASWYA